MGAPCSISKATSSVEKCHRKCQLLNTYKLNIFYQVASFSSAHILFISECQQIHDYIHKPDINADDLNWFPNGHLSGSRLVSNNALQVNINSFFVLLCSCHACEYAAYDSIKVNPNQYLCWYQSSSHPPES
jgi:hypothetical protein